MASEKSVTARIDTIFKQHVAGSQDLAPAEKVLIKAGTRLTLNSISPGNLQHVKLELAAPIKADDGSTQLKVVYAYQPHVELEGESQLIKLPVNYRGQNDNDWHPTFGEGNRQCNLT